MEREMQAGRSGLKPRHGGKRRPPSFPTWPQKMARQLGVLAAICPVSFCGLRMWGRPFGPTRRAHPPLLGVGVGGAAITQCWDWGWGTDPPPRGALGLESRDRNNS